MMIDDDRCGLIKTGDVNIQKPLAANFMDSWNGWSSLPFSISEMYVPFEDPG